MKQTKYIRTTSLSQQDRDKLEKRRLKAAKLFERGKTQSEVAKELKVSCEAARQWQNAWKKQGFTGLRSKGRPGPKPKLTEDKLKKVEQSLLKGPRSFGYTTDIWTLKRIKAVIKKNAGVSYHESYIWKILTNVMGWSCQKPKLRVKERDEKAIEHWKRYTWPNIKKKPKNSRQL